MIRRGVTLVELLVAAVLLAIVVAAGVPLLRDAREITESSPSTAALSVLALDADRAMRLDDADVWSPVEVARSGATAVLALSDADPMEVTPQRVESDSSSAWLVFQRGGLCVARWIELPEGEVEEAGS